jgi:DnaJ-class molecular chaperone
MSDLYCVLGVDCASDRSTIERAYKKLVLKYHPDKNIGVPQAEARFLEIQAAYDILRNDESREQYDEERCRAREAERKKTPFFDGKKRSHPEGNRFRTQYDQPYHREFADLWGKSCGDCPECKAAAAPSSSAKKHKIFTDMMAASPLAFGAKVTTRKTKMHDRR